MQNPFITTFSKIPDNTYIPTEQEQEITENFSFDRPLESVYKITGVRGSGKTVLLAKVEKELYAYSYVKIWEELTIEDRALVSILSNADELKREEVLSIMEKPNNYSVYRDRLLKRGIITSRQGYISLALPYFGEYVREYHG